MELGIRLNEGEKKTQRYLFAKMMSSIMMLETYLVTDHIVCLRIRLESETYRP